MGAQMRVYRQRIRSVQATKKITNAMELIAASRVVKARQRVAASTPYARALTRAVRPWRLLQRGPPADDGEHPEVRRAACASSSPATAAWPVPTPSRRSRRARSSPSKLRAEGKEVVPYLVGRKAVGFYKFRRRESAAEWAGFSDSPTFEDAKEIGDRITADFIKDYDEGGVDEVHVVFTRFARW